MNRYQTTEVLRNSTIRPGLSFLKTTFYPLLQPQERDLYVITTTGDRFDTLANQFYSDSSLWWIIAISNDDIVKDSLYPPLGIQLRIPTDISNIISKYNTINVLR
jgi:hypothetical protein